MTKSMLKNISDLINFDDFEFCCLATEEELTEDFEEVADSCFLLDNGADILAVAHMDSVCKPEHFAKFTLKNNEHLIFSPVLDDRAGVYIITHLLQELGINADILLTTNEEIGMSSAMGFFPTKEYNWGVEFDRAGDDVVLYEYDNANWKDGLKRYGFKTGIGIFSDISYLDDIGCSFVNIGTGLREGHTNKAFIVLDEMVMNLTKFYYFHRKFQHTLFPHTFKLKERKFTRYDHYSDLTYKFNDKYGSSTEFLGEEEDEDFRYADGF